MISFLFDGSAAKTAQWIAGKGPAIIRAVAGRLSLLMLKLQQHIVRDKLSGQVLHRRTGKLAGSILAYPVESEGTQLIGRVEGAGGVAWYGRVHEYGGTHAYDIFPIKGRALAFFPQGYANVVGGRQILRGMKRGSAGSAGAFAQNGGVFVRAVYNHPPLPMRSFMRSSAFDMRAMIIEQLQSAAQQAARGRA